MTNLCPVCHGLGRDHELDDFCERCHGDGFIISPDPELYRRKGPFRWLKEAITFVMEDIREFIPDYLHQNLKNSTEALERAHEDAAIADAQQRQQEEDEDNTNT